MAGYPGYRPQPASGQYRPPPQQRPPVYGQPPAYGARPGGYAPYGAAPGAGRGAPQNYAPPQYPQYPPNTNFRPPVGGQPPRGGAPPMGAAPGPRQSGPMYQPQPGPGRGAGPNPHASHQPPSYYGRPGGPGPSNPTMLKRQASLLRSAYPNSRFCRVFLNSGSTTGTSSSSAVSVSADLTRETARPSVDYTFAYEETVLSDAISSREAERAAVQDIEQRQSARKSEAADAQLRKIAVLQSVIQRDPDECRRLLEASNWDVDRATGMAYGSGDNLMEGVPIGGGGAQAEITLCFPDSTRLNFNLRESDTFWELYGRVIENRREYGSRPFNFRLGNGRTLTDANFDESLVQNFLTPAATIWVVHV